MMLPILISVSLAPGSYFFCALAAVAVMAMAAAHTPSAMNLLVSAAIVSLPAWPFVLPELSQAARALASIRLFRGVKRCCCAGYFLQCRKGGLPMHDQSALPTWPAT